MRKEMGLLKNDGDAPQVWGYVDVFVRTVEDVAVQLDGPAVGLDQPGEKMHQSRLAAPGTPKDAEPIGDGGKLRSEFEFSEPLLQ
jgi:hypothetical protein